jgi:hypothetical protein
MVVRTEKGISMSRARSLTICAGACLWGLLVCLGSGCGSGSPGAGGPVELKDREKIVAALPKGVTLETPIVPNILYGESSKTVEQALANLQAYVRDGVIHDGGLGREIRFDTKAPTPGTPNPADRSRKGGKAPYTVIVLAQPSA